MVFVAALVGVASLARGDDLEVREAALLKNYPQVFTREGSALIVALTNGARLHFVNTGASTEDVEVYTLDGYDPETNVVEILTGYWESSAALLLDRSTGQVLSIAAEPHVSDDGRRWAIVLSDMENGDADIQVARLTKQGLSIEADNLHFEGDDCKFLAWTTKDSFNFTCQRFSDGLDIEQTARIDSTGHWYTVALTPVEESK